MKKVGIVCDNYKLEKFKSYLNKEGFTDFEYKPFTNGTTAIFVNVEDDKVKKIHALCSNVEANFKRRN